MKNLNIIVKFYKNFNKRIDKFLVIYFKNKISRIFFQNLIKYKKVFVNNNIILKKSFKVKINDKILIYNFYNEKKKYETNFLNNNKIKKEKLNLNIIYKDKYIILINKSNNMVVYPTKKHKTKTLVNGLLYYFKHLSNLNGNNRPGIVHRLDKNTTGLIIIAKNNKTHSFLKFQFKNRIIIKKYIALVYGNVKKEKGIINIPIGHSKKDYTKQVVINKKKNNNNIKNAITYYKVLKRFINYSLLELNLKTGRTHQIRVHLNFIGHPIVGDFKYNFNKKKNINNQIFLHSYSLSFFHPINNKRIFFKARLPFFFRRTLFFLNKEKF